MYLHRTGSPALKLIIACSDLLPTEVDINCGRASRAAPWPRLSSLLLSSLELSDTQVYEPQIRDLLVSQGDSIRASIPQEHDSCLGHWSRYLGIGAVSLISEGKAPIPCGKTYI